MPSVRGKKGKAATRIEDIDTMNATNWRTPAVVLACGSVILMLSLGTRQSFGLFLQPMSSDLGWGRETFAFALALQNLVWGLAQPFAGMIADKFGAARILIIAGALYTLGLVLMAFSDTGLAFNISAGLLVGLGLSGSAFGVVMGVVGRAFPPEKRSMALGIVGAGGSFGQFIMLPYGQVLISQFGWLAALLVLAVSSFLIVPLAAAFSGKSAVGGRGNQSMAEAIREAATHRGFWYLTAAFLVCGFQTIFIMVHLPAYLVDKGMAPVQGMTALALIGLFNIIGSYLCGYLGGHFSKKYLLSWIYGLRSVAILMFIMLPVTQWSTWVFSAVLGLTWLGTVPLTNGLVAQIFGVRYLSTLFSISFLGHQVGSFLGAWYGGYMFDATGSYLTVWVVAAALGVLACILCLPINESEMGSLPSSKPVI
jgi:predicted MFS family arabinose efflux permease